VTNKYKPPRRFSPCRLDFKTPRFPLSLLLFNNHRFLPVPIRGYHLSLLHLGFLILPFPPFSPSLFPPSPPHLHSPLSPHSHSYNIPVQLLFIILFIMKFVQLGIQIKTRCEKKKIYKDTHKKVHYEVHKNHIIKSTSDSQNSEICPFVKLYT